MNCPACPFVNPALVITVLSELTSSVPDPASLAQSDPVLVFSGGSVLQSTDVVDEGIVNILGEQRCQPGVE